VDGTVLILREVEELLGHKGIWILRFGYRRLLLLLYRLDGENQGILIKIQLRLDCCLLFLTFI